MSGRADSIRAVTISIPARNEEDRIVGCLRSIQTAVVELGGAVGVTVVVSCDSCSDATIDRVREVEATFPVMHAIVGSWGTAGGARRAAIEHGLARLAEDGFTAKRRIWIATTDADTHVPPDWLDGQLCHAARGADAVAGPVDLLADHDRSPEVIEHFASTYALSSDGHPHVHGANLGVRASAYLAAGGFLDVAVAEDHSLWNSLRRGMFRCVSPVDLRVATSARLRGRAPGGFADAIAAALAP